MEKKNPDYIIQQLITLLNPQDLGLVQTEQENSLEKFTLKLQQQKIKCQVIQEILWDIHGIWGKYLNTPVSPRRRVKQEREMFEKIMDKYFPKLTLRDYKNNQ